MLPAPEGKLDHFQRWHMVNLNLVYTPTILCSHSSWCRNARKQEAGFVAGCVSVVTCEVPTEAPKNSIIDEWFKYLASWFPSNSPSSPGVHKSRVFWGRVHCKNCLKGAYPTLTAVHKLLKHSWCQPAGFWHVPGTTVRMDSMGLVEHFEHPTRFLSKSQGKNLFFEGVPFDNPTWPLTDHGQWVLTSL